MSNQQNKQPQFVRAVFDLHKMSVQEVYDLGKQLCSGFTDNKVISFGYKDQSHCEWTKELYGMFGSRYKVSCCDNYQVFNFGNVYGNDFEYCPYCGMGIIEIGGDNDI